MDVADKGARLGNFLFDLICILLLYLMLVLLVSNLFDYFDYDGTSIIDLLFVCLYFGYYFTFELILNKTPGKYLTKTIVVNTRGTKPGLKDLLFRSICRVFPFDLFSFVFGTGLHDTFSGTTVVRSKNNS